MSWLYVFIWYDYINFLDRCELQSRDKVERIQWEFITCLQYLLKSRRKFTHLMDLIIGLRDLTEWHSRISKNIVLKWPVVQNHPLILELCSFWCKPPYAKRVLKVYFNFYLWNAHAQSFIGWSSLAFCFRLLPSMYFECVNSKGSGKTACFHGLTRTFTVLIYVKQPFWMSWLK